MIVRLQLASAVALAAAVWVAASGCIIVPVPHPEGPVYGSRRAITEREAQSILPGVTTREDVLLRFGEPDFWWDGERVLVYGWTTSNLGFFMAAAGGYSAAAAWWDSPIASFLLCEFDGRGRVVRRELATAPAFKTGPAFVTELRGAWSRPAPAAPVSPPATPGLAGARGGGEGAGDP